MRVVPPAFTHSFSSIVRQCANGPHSPAQPGSCGGIRFSDERGCCVASCLHTYISFPKTFQLKEAQLREEIGRWMDSFWVLTADLKGAFLSQSQRNFWTSSAVMRLREDSADRTVKLSLSHGAKTAAGPATNTTCTRGAQERKQHVYFEQTKTHPRKYV